MLSIVGIVSLAVAAPTPTHPHLVNGKIAFESYGTATAEYLRDGCQRLEPDQPDQQHGR